MFEAKLCTILVSIDHALVADFAYAYRSLKSQWFINLKIGMTSLCVYEFFHLNSTIRYEIDHHK